MAIKERSAPTFDDIFDAEIDAFDFGEEDTKSPKQEDITAAESPSDNEKVKNDSKDLPSPSREGEEPAVEESKRPRIPGKVKKRVVKGSVVGAIVETLVNEKYLEQTEKEDVQQVRKYYFTQKKTGEIYSIAPGAHFTIGADPSFADLLIDDNQTVSRRHAEISVSENGDFFIKDIGSRNGTRVNDVEIPENEQVQVGVGDSIAFSDEVFLVTEAGS